MTFVTNCYYTCDCYYICDQILHLCLQQSDNKRHTRTNTSLSVLQRCPMPVTRQLVVCQLNFFTHRLQKETTGLSQYVNVSNVYQPYVNIPQQVCSIGNGIINALQHYNIPVDVLVAGMLSIMLMCSAVLLHLPAIKKHVT